MEEIEYLNEEYGLDISTEASIGFWNKIGGKLIWGAVILFIVVGNRRGKKDEGEEPAPSTDASAGAE